MIPPIAITLPEQAVIDAVQHWLNTNLFLIPYAVTSVECDSAAGVFSIGLALPVQAPSPAPVEPPPVVEPSVIGHPSSVVRPPVNGNGNHRGANKVVTATITRARVHELCRDGLDQQQIADQLDITRSALYAHLKDLRETGEIAEYPLSPNTRRCVKSEHLAYMGSHVADTNPAIAEALNLPISSIAYHMARIRAEQKEASTPPPAAQPFRAAAATAAGGPADR